MMALELLDAFDQGRSNSSSGNNGYNAHNLYQNQRFRPNVYGESSHSNENNFRGRNFVPNMNQNNSGATPSHAQQNTNFDYNRGPGSIAQNYRNDSLFCLTNLACHEGRNYAYNYVTMIGAIITPETMIEDHMIVDSCRTACIIIVKM